jgi:hypothetical protein
MAPKGKTTRGKAKGAPPKTSTSSKRGAKRKGARKTEATAA